MAYKRQGLVEPSTLANSNLVNSKISVVVELRVKPLCSQSSSHPIPSGSTYHHPITEHFFNSEFGVHSR